MRCGCGVVVLSVWCWCGVPGLRTKVGTCGQPYLPFPIDFDVVLTTSHRASVRFTALVGIMHRNRIRALKQESTTAAPGQTCLQAE